MKLLQTLMMSVGLLAVSLTAAIAQSWQFATDATGKGVASIQTAEASVSFSCFGPGLPQHDASTVEWRIDSPSLVNALPTGIAAVAELELSIDGQSVGKGPFQRISNDSIATRLPRSLPLIGMMRFSDQMTVGVGGADVVVRLPVKTMDAAFSKLLRYCDAPNAVPAAPKRNLVNAIPPLDPSGLTSVLWDPKQVQLRFFIEAVRRAPKLLDQDPVLAAWAALALNQNDPNPTPEWKAATRASIVNTLDRFPAGPFLIGRFNENPFRYGSVYANGAMVAQDSPLGRRFNPETLGYESLFFPNFGQVSIRARAQHDVNRLPVSQENAAILNARAGSLRLGVVTQIDDLEVVSDFGGNVRIIARGGVRFAGLFERLPPGAPAGSTGVLTVIFPMIPVTAPPAGLQASADLVGVNLFEGAVLDGRATSSRGQNNGTALTTLVDWAIRKKTPMTAIDENLRNRIFFDLATSFERDAVVDPFFREDTGSTQSRINFAPHVNEFERADLLANIDRDLWPTVRDRLPAFPINGIALARATLGAYDTTLGGFPIDANVEELGLPAIGPFPAFSSLPDLLPATVPQAKKLIADLEATNGVGNRNLLLVARFTIDDAAPSEDSRRGSPTYYVTPVSLSLHGQSQFVEGSNPFDLKIQDFDITRYRGPKRPVAKPEQIAFWTQIEEAKRSTSDEVSLAALKLSTDGRYLEMLAQNQPAVRAAHLLDVADVVASEKIKIQSLPAPSILVLDGTLQLEQYTIGSGFRVENYSLAPVEGSRNFRQPRIAFSNPVLPEWLTPTEPVARLAITRIGGRNSNSGTFRFTAWVVPERLEFDRNTPVLRVRASRVVLEMLEDQGSGYPAAHVEFKPGAIADYVNNLSAK